MTPAFLATSRLLADRKIHLFFLFEGHFCDPLVPRERTRLEEGGVVTEALESVIAEHLAADGSLPPGTYFPMPIARGLEAGELLPQLLKRFYYEPIEVDQDQVWWWKGHRVAERNRRFFLEHVDYEPALEVYFFEYQVNPNWWDKRYLDAEVTPLLATSLRVDGEEAWVDLEGGRRTPVDLNRLRLDQQERLFCGRVGGGEVLFSENARFRVLQGVSEDLRRVRLGSKQYCLARLEQGPGTFAGGTS